MWGREEETEREPKERGQAVTHNFTQKQTPLVTLMAGPKSRKKEKTPQRRERMEEEEGQRPGNLRTRWGVSHLQSQLHGRQRSERSGFKASSDKNVHLTPSQPIKAGPGGECLSSQLHGSINKIIMVQAGLYKKTRSYPQTAKAKRAGAWCRVSKG
jgi:hypothetical protein